MSSPVTTPVPVKDHSGLLGWRRALMFGFFVALVLLALPLTGLDGWVDRTIARGPEFRLRAALGFGPALDPRIKVFAFDDEAAAAVGATDLPLSGWARLLKSLAAHQPRMILIDKTFAYPALPEDARAFAEAVGALGVPVATKAHAEPGELAHATELPVRRFGLSLTNLVRDSARRQPPEWIPDTPMHVYGPPESLAPAFAQIGHDRDAEDSAGVVQPLVNAGSTLMLPHWTLYAGGAPRLERTGLYLGDAPVLLDGDGRLTVDLVAPDACRERVQSLAGAFAATRRGEAAPGVEPGDTVLILPEMYAGAVNFQKTALGRIPVGFVHLALVNSAITGAWISVMPAGPLMIVLLSLAGSGLAVLYAHRRWFPALLIGVGLILALAGISTFVLGSILVPWALPALGLLITGGFCRGEAVKLAERQAAMLRHDLHGILSPERLSSLAGGQLRDLEATEQVVTIMFIDIVGFSRAAEKQTPKEAFSSLKSLIDQLRRAVHDYGGVVDRTMGDGMLCVFGYDFGSLGQSALVHAEQAARCAVQIQRDNLQRMLKAHKTNQAVFPLRIGINTTGVYLGNLGDTERTDLTVIGNGVNFAQRLEAACDRHMAMIGVPTADLLIDVGDIAPMLRKRHIRVKHATELTEAYELDPFYSEPRLLLDGDEAYRQFIGIERNDVRSPVPYPGLIKVMTNYGDGEMINFSFDGFTIKLPEYYAKDVTVSLKMDTLDGALGERLEAVGLASLILEVRWARPSGDGYIHGCLIKNLNAEQREMVISLLRDAIQRYVAAERRIA